MKCAAFPLRRPKKALYAYVQKREGRSTFIIHVSHAYGNMYTIGAKKPSYATGGGDKQYLGNHWVYLSAQKDYPHSMLKKQFGEPLPLRTPQSPMRMK